MKELTQEQIEFLNLVVRGSWALNPETGLIDVVGGVNALGVVKGDELPVYFGKVTEDFLCHNNTLTTLEGCPYWVGKSFRCQFNELPTH